MKNFSKILAFCILSMFFVSNVAADEWAEEDCLEYEQLIGGLAWLFVKLLICLTKQEKQEKKRKQKNCLKQATTDGI